MTGEAASPPGGVTPGPLRTLAALALLGAGSWAALHHPLSATIALAAFIAWTGLCLWRPLLGLTGALALLPLAGLAPWAMQGAAFLGGIASGTLTLAAAAAVRSGDPRLALILCGVVVGALAAALLGLALLAADPYTELPTLTWWLLGAFSRATLAEAVVALGLTSAAAAVLLTLGARLDALALGEDQARALGLPARTLRLLALATAALATSAVVSISGLVGWIGLLAPHAARLLVGETAARLLPMSALLGAAVALIVGQLARAFGPAEIPVGLLTALVGAPAFLALFISRAGRRP
ncbi:MAG: FecCD family ABC transporter permease [Brevundimonas sp.]